MQSVVQLLSRFRKDERGAFAVIFAVIAVVLIATSGAVVDFSRVQQARTKAQTALDAATLTLQSQISTQTVAQLKTKAQALLTERINDSSVTATITTVTVDTIDGKLYMAASLSLPTAFVQLVGIKTLSSNLQSEVTQASSDVEVSVSLDVTGSMSGSKIDDLIDATNLLIDYLVQDVQTPTYSKMAIVPWSAAVNVGAYANTMRGAVRGPWSISGVNWTLGAAKTVTCATRANPGVITTSSAHSFSNGDRVYFYGVTGMTQLNGNTYVIANVTASTFTIVNTSSGYSAFSCSGGSANTGNVIKCQTTACEITVTTSAPHTLVSGDTAFLSSIGGATGLNNAYYTVALPTSMTFILSGTYGPSYGTYTSGGQVECILYSCSLYRFNNDSNGALTRFPVSTCVTERTTNAFTDEAPSTTALSYHYAKVGASNNGCLNQAIQPLTSDKTVLHALTNSLTAAGSTAGQLGLAWGWYMVSPTFSPTAAPIWPTASQPKPYKSKNLIKAVVFMTDGDFNTPYCNGVISGDSLSGSGSTADHINCNAPNGSSKSQAQTLCNSIKVSANGILLYTIGFDLAGNTAALNMLRDCASTPDYFKQADDGSDLKAAFKQIAESLSELRISK